MSEADDAPASTADAAVEETKPAKEETAPDTTTATVSTAPGPSVSAPSAVPTPSSSYPYPLAPQPSTLAPATQQQISPSPAIQHVQAQAPPVSMANAPQMQPPPTDNSAFPQKPQHVSHTPIAMGMAPAPPVSMQGPTISQYYPDMTAAVTSPDGYELVDSSRLLSGRSKKDVKRRTKTGCLTCRKRRIKCDERHPVCRNCEKSKRDCLGYDPVFKPPGTSALQPACPHSPAVGASQAQSVDASVVADSHATSGSASYPASRPEATASSTSPGVEGGLSPPSISVQDTAEPQVAAPRNSLEGAEKLELREMGVEDLFAVRGQLCQPLEPLTSTPARIEDIKLLFTSYAVAIDRFLECHWYEAKGMSHLLANGQLLAQYASLLDGFNDSQIQDPTFLARLESRETRIIWDTMTLCRQAHTQEGPTTDGNTTTPTDPELLYAVKRFSVFEALITGATLGYNPVGLDAHPESESRVHLSGLGGQIKNRELQFWESIGRYVSVSNDQVECEKQRESILMFSRTLLDSFENRDIIYSMAIIRNIAKYQPRKLKPLVGSTDEKDAAAKLYVACKFLEDESQGKGTNQTVKRLSNMVLQHWERPGYNM